MARDLIALAAAAVVLAAVGPSGHDHQQPSSPVFTPATAWDAYPLAAVSGVLQLDHGCLVLGRSIVVWPSGTSWDPAQQAVIFSGPFRTAPPVPVGAELRSAGGYYEEADLPWLVGGERASDAAACLDRTDADLVVLAWPERPASR